MPACLALLAPPPQPSTRACTPPRAAAFLRAVLAFMRPFVSKKAGRKIKQVRPGPGKGALAGLAVGRGGWPVLHAHSTHAIALAPISHAAAP